MDLMVIGLFLLFVEFCRLEASLTGVNLFSSISKNTSSDFAVKALSGDVSSRVEAPAPHKPSRSAVKAPHSNKA